MLDPCLQYLVVLDGNGLVIDDIADIILHDQPVDDAADDLAPPRYRNGSSEYAPASCLKIHANSSCRSGCGGLFRIGLEPCALCGRQRQDSGIPHDPVDLKSA